MPSRVLNSGGSLLIITANPDAYAAWKSFYRDAKFTGKKFEGTMQLGEVSSYDVLYLHTFEEIRDSFRDAGMHIEKTETFLQMKDSARFELLISIQGTKSVPRG